DGIGGATTVIALHRLRSKGPESADTAAVRESLRWASVPPTLAGRRVALGEAGGVGAFLPGGQHAPPAQGALVTLLSHPDPSVLAGQANATESELYVGFALSAAGHGCRAAYWGAHGTISPAGRRLAGLILDELSIGGAGTDGPPIPMATT